MGFNVNRFNGQIEDELICSICSAVLEDPVQISECEHMFCRLCITEWLRRNYTCPVDRRSLSTDDVGAVPRIVRNMLSRLTMSCDFEPYGCTKVLKLDGYKEHIAGCEHDPRRPAVCERGCGLAVPAMMQKDHECVGDMRGILMKQQIIICEQSLIIRSLKRERNLYREFARFYHLNQPNQVSDLASRIDEDEVYQWKEQMSIVEEVDWSEVVGIPHTEDYRELKSALYDSGCPTFCQSGLIERSEQSKWPVGMASEFRRMANRRVLGNYVCRQMEQINALVVLQRDNSHMVDDFEVPMPGIIVILKQEEPDLSLPDL